ncbi:hypothetical protein FB446DRAFT_715314 [Lentinula raphanica]|uniref:DNA recombination and repair protein Rad51-like C-terminal domain-containing protein n=1 Tax=Lentinula raphanica TaxID=153919 RepID=A0AA38PBQ8_9AGAR|nr:hypothetical protein C8R42DRAFT_722480 [Lentinula raphanica]KAJ3778033.1 hypothetical protein FB446DRAFT_715314 [Lentinula raphanica]KAJ3839801.1 hypothetical protein F5878DRAFT_101668 [Lentinula raphanica]
MDFNQMIQEIGLESLLSALSSVRREAESETLDFITTRSSNPTPSTRQELSFSLPRLGDVVEIQGPSASGKSHLLYLLVIICIIPTTYASISLGGWDKAAILFDTDASFDPTRFRRLLTSHLGTALSDKDSDVGEQLVKRSLQNLHIFCPASTTQLAATLLSLPSYHHTHLPDSEIGILAIDSMSAFYWSDRFAAEQLHTTNPSTPKESANPFRHVVTALQRFHRSHKPLVIFTNWGLTPAQSSPATDVQEVLTYRQHLNPPPALFPIPEAPAVHSSSGALPLTLHIVLSVPPLQQIVVGSSAEDAWAQQLAGTRTNSAILGVVRSSNSSQTSKFTLDIQADRIDISVT